MAASLTFRWLPASENMSRISYTAGNFSYCCHKGTARRRHSHPEVRKLRNHLQVMNLLQEFLQVFLVTASRSYLKALLAGQHTTAIPMRECVNTSQEGTGSTYIFKDRRNRKGETDLVQGQSGLRKSASTRCWTSAWCLCYWSLTTTPAKRSPQTMNDNKRKKKKRTKSHADGSRGSTTLGFMGTDGKGAKQFRGLFTGGTRNAVEVTCSHLQV